MRGMLQRLGGRLPRSLLLLVIVASIASSAGAEPEPESASTGPTRLGVTTWFAQAMARTDAGLNITHFWSKGAQLRAETIIAGRKVVTIVSGRRYTTWDALSGAGLSLERSEAAVLEDSPDVRPFGREFDTLLAQGAEKVRDDTLHGAACEVYRITDRSGRRELYVLAEEPRLPVRIDIFDRSRGRNFRTEYIGWQAGLPISDGFFVPDANLRLVTMSIEEYAERSATGKPVGSVPILYADLLHGDREASPVP